MYFIFAGRNHNGYLLNDSISFFFYFKFAIFFFIITIDIFKHI